MPYTTSTAGTTITASWANTNVRDQAVTPFASAAARDSAITSPVNGMLCYLTDIDLNMVYDGAQWVRASSNIVKYQEQTANGSVISANATTDFALSAVVTHSTRLYKVSLFSTLTVTALCVWRVNFHVDGTLTDRMFDINTQNASDLTAAASILWTPTAGSKALDLRVVEEAGTSDLQFKAAGDNRRRFWVEDIGPLIIRHRKPKTIDPDNLDGCCDLDCDNGPPVSDELTPFVVLFARQLDPDLTVNDRIAAHLRAAEWRNLFGDRRGL